MLKKDEQTPSRAAFPRANRRTSVQPIYQGNAFSVKRHQAREPGGLRVVRDVVHHPGSAVILPVFPDRRILLIRQYRLAVQETIWELPAGTLDPGERPLQAARRELAEETGYRSARWRKLNSFYPSPGLLSERMHLFLAQDVRPGIARPEEDERIRSRSFSLAALLRMIRSGAIKDGKSLVGLLYWAQWEAEPPARRR